MSAAVRRARSAEGGVISTETAVTFFQLSAGVFGGIAALVAAQRLSEVEGGTVSLQQLALPVAIAGGSTIAGAFLLPAE